VLGTPEAVRRGGLTVGPEIIDQTLQSA